MKTLSSSVLTAGVAVALLLAGGTSASALSMSPGGSSCTVSVGKGTYTATVWNSTCSSVKAGLYYRDSGGTLRWSTPRYYSSTKSTATAQTSMITSRYAKARKGSAYSSWTSF